MLPSSDTDIYGTLRGIGLLSAWSEDEFLTRLAAGRKTVKARDESVRTSEAILEILSDLSRPEPGACRFEDAVGEAIQIVEALRAAAPDLGSNLEYVDEAWEWDAYADDDDARDAGADLDERFGAPCLLTVQWKGLERRLFWRTLPDLCRVLNGLFKESGLATRFYVVAARRKGATVLVLDEERVRKLNASGILLPDETHFSVA